MRSRVLAPLVVFGSALLVYLLTMPPGLTWAHESADGGDLIAAVVSGSVPHPSGYPTFVLFATPLARLPWQNPAWRVTLLSALAGAASAAFVAATVQTVLGRASMAAIVAGLMLAFSSVFWGQATVVEVYALHACLAAALLWCAVRSRQSVSPAWTAAAGLVFGLALGNHLTSLWLAPLFLVSLLTPTPWSGRRGWHRRPASRALRLSGTAAAGRGQPAAELGRCQHVGWVLVVGQRPALPQLRLRRAASGHGEPCGGGLRVAVAELFPLGRRAGNCRTFELAA